MTKCSKHETYDRSKKACRPKKSPGRPKKQILGGQKCNKYEFLVQGLSKDKDNGICFDAKKLQDKFEKTRAHINPLTEQDFSLNDLLKISKIVVSWWTNEHEKYDKKENDRIKRNIDIEEVEDWEEFDWESFQRATIRMQQLEIIKREEDEDNFHPSEDYIEKNIMNSMND